MDKWTRMKFMPCVPLGEDGRLVSSCKAHTDFSRYAATEGMVLLKNEGVLPIAKGNRVAVFGKAQFDWIDEVANCIPKKYSVRLLDGLHKAQDDGELEIFEGTEIFYRNYIDNHNKKLEDYSREAIEITRQMKYPQEPDIPEMLMKSAVEYTDTAIIVLCRRGAESDDRKPEDFYLSQNEKNLIDSVCENFSKVIALLNMGAQIETDWIKENDRLGAALLVGYPGMEGGFAVADVLLGKANPSGKLVDTYAKDYSDYPSSAYFNLSATETKYYEDIYVGYRYFETVPGAKEKVNYPFGFGLSYTTFDISKPEFMADDEKIYIKTVVTNTGNVAGKEVVQVYYGAPQGKLGKPARELGAFAKTKLLESGESQEISLEIKIADMASYDDYGKCAMSAYVLEKGAYCFFVGNSVRDAKKADFEYIVEEEYRIVCQLSQQAKSMRLEKRMLADGTFEELPLDTYPMMPYPKKLPFIQPKLREKRIMLIDVAEGRAEMDDFIAQLDREYM
ncbi:MAG: glycoside hydrolase family 3 C-terminal domain-containing protein, partial [Clostridia bacterium]|nr:glycoside hydrolase family 3 C-terminal domain-containing protein [Clostridia bacterium]